MNTANSQHTPGEILGHALIIVVMSAVFGLTSNALSPEGLPLDYRVIKEKQAAETRRAADAAGVPIIHLAEAKKLWETKDARFLDARSADFFTAAHISGALSLPVHDFAIYYGSATKGLQRGDLIVTYCAGKSCQSSLALAKMLKEKGFTNIKAFLGGWEEWSKAHLAVAKGQVNKPIPIKAAVPPGKASVPTSKAKVTTVPPAATPPVAPVQTTSAPKVVAIRPQVPPRPKSATSNPNRNDSDTIGIEAAHNLFKEGRCIFVDARLKDDFIKGHVAGAISLPLETFDESFPAVADSLSSGLLIVIYCDGKDCNSSTELAKKLRDMGFSEAKAFVGGWNAWKKAGYPIRTGEGS